MLPDLLSRTYIMDIRIENAKTPHLNGLLFFLTIIAHIAMPTVAAKQIP